MVALAARAAFSIIARTASTSVSLAALQPDSSQTMCVPSAFNSLFLTLSGAFGWENPTSRCVVQRVRYTVSLSTYQQNLAGTVTSLDRTDVPLRRRVGRAVPYRLP